ncbi:MAG: hypothetical protein V7L04_04675 [Nostoc sp.]
MKNSTPKGMEFLGMGHGEWGRITNTQCPMPNAQCPKSVYSPLNLRREKP